MIITRYLSKSIITVAVFVTIALTMVIWLTQSLKLLELVVNSDAPASVFMQLVFLSLPRFLEIILPLSLVTAILFTYNKLIMDNELIVMRSCGVNQLALAKPVLLLAVTTTIFLLALTTYISPQGYAQMQQMRQNVKSQYASLLVREGVFNTFGNDLTVYVRRRSSEGDLTGILIHDTRDREKPPVTVTAKRGRLALENDIPHIVVFDGMRQQIDKASGTTNKLFFARYTIEIKGFADKPWQRWREPNERTFIELLNPDMTNKYDAINKSSFTVEAHHRLITPLNALGFSLVCLACILLGPFNRRGQNRKVLAAALIVILLQAINLSVISLARKHIGFLPLLYIATFTPIAIGFYLLTLRGEQQLMNIIRQLRLSGKDADEGAA